MQKQACSSLSLALCILYSPVLPPYSSGCANHPQTSCAPPLLWRCMEKRGGVPETPLGPCPPFQAGKNGWGSPPPSSWCLHAWQHIPHLSCSSKRHTLVAFVESWWLKRPKQTKRINGDIKADPLPLRKNPSRVAGRGEFCRVSLRFCGLRRGGCRGKWRKEWTRAGVSMVLRSSD